MIQLFLLNLFLAIVYSLLVGEFGILTFITGFVLGYVVITLYALTTNQPSYPMKAIRLMRFAAYFLYILVKANLQIAWEIITPGLSQQPRLIRYPVGRLDAVETTTLSNCITLTPGTLVVDISDDEQWLYIHCMYAKDRDSAVAELDELADRLHREVFA